MAPDVQAPDVLQATEVLRIGALDESDYTLTHVGALAIGPDDHLFVAQPRESLIRVYDSTGAFVRIIGGPGEGPGEFDFLVHLGFLADTLYAVDPGLRRVSLFSPEGILVRTETLTSPEVGESFLPTPPFLLLGDGTAVVSPSFPSGGVARFPYLRIDRSGAVLDTLVWHELEGRRVTVPSDLGPIRLDHPFPDFTLVLIDPERERLIHIERPSPRDLDDGGFSVIWTTLEGDTLRAARHAHRPRPVSDEERDEALQVLSDSRALGMAFPDPDNARRAVLAELTLPDFHPPVRAAVLGDEGAIWIALESEREARRTWMVLDSEGRLQDHAELPPHIRLHAARGDRVWGVEVDALDVPYLVQYQIGGG